MDFKRLTKEQIKRGNFTPSKKMELRTKLKEYNLREEKRKKEDNLYRWLFDDEYLNNYLKKAGIK